MHIAATSEGDYNFLSMPLTFSFGSADGSLVCANITVLSDNMVESEEDFTVRLSLLTIGKNLFIGNNATAVTLTDSDSKLHTKL